MSLSNDDFVAFYYRSYGTFFYNKRDPIIPTVVLPTTEIIEPILLSKISLRKLMNIWLMVAQLLSGL